MMNLLKCCIALAIILVHDEDVGQHTWSCDIEIIKGDSDFIRVSP